MLGSAFFVTENLVKKTNKQTNKQKRKFSFVILPPFPSSSQILFYLDRYVLCSFFVQ